MIRPVGVSRLDEQTDWFAGGVPWDPVSGNPLGIVMTDNTRASTVAPSLLPAGVAAAVATLSIGAHAQTSVTFWGNGGLQLTPPPSLPELRSISIAEHAAALQGDGGVRCWGNNNSGQCDVTVASVRKLACASQATLALLESGSVIPFGASVGATQVPGNLGPCLDVDAISRYGAGVRTTGVIWTWGSPPVSSGIGTNIRRVAAGGNFVLGLREDGAVLGWGPGSVAQSVPPALGMAAEIDAGQSHALARRADGTIFCWGSGIVDIPAEAATGIAVAAGASSSLVLRADGRVVQWGRTLGGAALEPVPAALANVSAIAANDVGAIAISDVRTAVTRWDSASGGNGHYYDIVVEAGLTWDQAKARAEALGGHLATITSASEQAHIAELLALQPGALYTPSLQLGPYIGARQAAGSVEPSGGWTWVTGEPWSYAAWGVNEPSNAMCTPSGQFVPESVAQLTGAAALWNDVSDAPASCFGWIATGFVVEWEADCDGDGLVDIGQILEGQLADTNSDGVPDACQEPPCAPADIFRDGNVNGADLGILLAQWGAASQSSVSDLNSDGVVDGADLGVLLSFWGACATW